MKPTLETLGRCFQGLVPAAIATCDLQGVPNATLLSQVYYVDERHVALSCQFFNKTRRNVEENPHAIVEVMDPLTLETYRLRLRYLRSETEGPLFDAMSLRIQAIASITGMEGIFRLLSADVYEVLELTHKQVFASPPPAPPQEENPYLQVKAVQLISQQLVRARDLDELLGTLLESLDRTFGVEHAMVLVPDGSGGRLVGLASRGYGEQGIGAEVAVGDGIIGAVAEQRRPLRLSGLRGELAYGRAIRERAREVAGAAPGPEIALPGLADAQSQMALPLVVQDRLVGVLFVESGDPLAFDEWDEACLEILANQIAVGIDKLAAREDEDAPVSAPPVRLAAAPAPAAAVRTFTFFHNDDCVFADGEYLIRNVPGRILWRLLTAYEREGRREFTNRELRLDSSLGLPELRDNLESRLILLRKRLEQQCPDVRIVPVRRGRFALEVRCALRLVEKEARSGAA